MEQNLSMDTFLDCVNLFKQIERNEKTLKKEGTFSAFILTSIVVDGKNSSGGFVQVGSDIDIINMLVQSLKDEPRTERNLKIAIKAYHDLKKEGKI